MHPLTQPPIIAYHGTPALFSAFDDSTVGGLHFGTLNQASHALSIKVSSLPLEQFEALPVMPGGQPGRMIKARLAINKPKRVADAITAQDWHGQIVLARREGYDALVYDNRLEMPSDGDSWVVFSSAQITILEDTMLSMEWLQALREQWLERLAQHGPGPLTQTY